MAPIAWSWQVSTVIFMVLYSVAAAAVPVASAVVLPLSLLLLLSSAGAA